jgi:uncharacterized NAD(P)/FAD-binding protein YdhS
MPAIAIIGSGFSGVATAAHLTRLPWPRGLRIVLVERGPRFARGVAYSTDHPLHLLNVPAGRMGALADDEGHFLGWLRRSDPSLTGDTFVPRTLYGDYLEWLLDDSASRAPDVEITRRSGDVVDVSLADRRARLHLRDGDSLEADRVVLALGNLPPRDPLDASAAQLDSRYLRDAWAPGALASLPRTTWPILFVGSGLTMVDALLALRDRGHDAGFIAVSRHGQLPQSHRDRPAKPPVVDVSLALEHWDGSMRPLLALIREASSDATQSDLDWRDVVNGLRPITAQLWRRMPPRERERFLRHVRPFWESHRHRMSTRIADQIDRLIDRRELSVVAGRVLEVLPEADSMRVSVGRRGGGMTERYRVGAIVNCTGPDGDFTRLKEPLVVALRQRGALSPDPLGLGVVTDDEGALVDARGRASSVLFTLGSPRRADSWESTAVPELRAQADRLSRRLRASVTETSEG